MINSFKSFSGIVAPLDRSNVDTDTVIPKQYLKSIKRTGFGVNLFDDWRYLDPGNPGDDHSIRRLNPDFVLNQDRYKGAGILLARKNFGCGSSREHAVWALLDYGFRAVIASSYADIFSSNAFKNGLLPISLPDEIVDRIFKDTFSNSGYNLMIDLEKQVVITPENEQITFEIDPAYKERMLKGLDDIDMTLKYTNEIHAYESRRSKEAPWLFPENQ